jgi:hypothetical protein
MMKRFFWFSLGVVAGATGLMWARRKAIAAAEARFFPFSLTRPRHW